MWFDGRFCGKRVSVRDGAGPVVSHGQNIIQRISHGVGHLVNCGIGRGCVEMTVQCVDNTVLCKELPGQIKLNRKEMRW